RAACPGSHTRGKSRLLDVGRRIRARDRFAPDSPRGFELLVPPRRNSPRGTPCGFRARLGQLREAPIPRGTKSSNSASSRGKSTNHRFRRRLHAAKSGHPESRRFDRQVPRRELKEGDAYAGALIETAEPSRATPV